MFEQCRSAHKIEVRVSVTYLGHIIDAAELYPLQNKVKIIIDVPTPYPVSELKPYLGILTLLWKIPSQAFLHIVPTLPFTKEGRTMEMEIKSRENICTIKKEADIIQMSNSL